jgi:hypothetical protein
MAPVAGAAAAGSSPRSQVPVFVLDKGRFTGFDAPAPQDLVRINNRGQIVRGFLRDRRGRFARIDFPGAAGTQPNDLNDRGQVVGEYQDASGSFHGYLWDRGWFTTLDGPDGTGASATDINDRGQIICAYASPTDPGTNAGFLLSKGVYTTIDAPDAPLPSPSVSTTGGRSSG